MKRIITLILLVSLTLAMTACGGSGTKSSLTEDELQNAPFPTGYTYETFVGDKSTDSGKYTYPKDIDHSLLIPIQATMSDRQVTKSQIKNDLICTDCTVTLQDGTKVKIQYNNDPKTLDFVNASVENGKETTKYTFNY